MDTTLKKLIVFLLGMTGLITAYARPGWYQDEGAYRQHDVARQIFVNERQQRPDQQDQNGRRRPSGGRDDNQYNAAPNAPPQKNSKLSPEERRALRRQINEAGQDIYYNSRRGGN